LLGTLLAIPLSILANVLTPRFQRWYAETSEKRLHRRIDRLTRDLTEAAWTYSQAEWNIQQTVNLLVMVMVYGMYVVFAILLAAFAAIRAWYPNLSLFNMSGQEGRGLAASLATLYLAMTLGILMTVLLAAVTAIRHRKYRQFYTESGRKRMEEELVSLHKLRQEKYGPEEES